MALLNNGGDVMDFPKRIGLTANQPFQVTHAPRVMARALSWHSEDNSGLAKISMGTGPEPESESFKGCER